MLAGLAGVLLPVVCVFLLVRLVDLGVRGQFGLLYRFDVYSIMWLLETALCILGIALLWSKRQRNNLGNLFLAAMVLLVFGGLYRFDVYLVAFRPGVQWSYFPSVTEILITAGLVAGEIAAYIALIKTFPILAGSKPGSQQRALAQGA